MYEQEFNIVVFVAKKWNYLFWHSQTRTPVCQCGSQGLDSWLMACSSTRWGAGWQKASQTGQLASQCTRLLPVESFN